MQELEALVAKPVSGGTMSRRDAIRAVAALAGCALFTPRAALAGGPWNLCGDDEEFLDELERRGCLFFLEQASEETGQVQDRARYDLGGAFDPRHISSIAATGFGLTALCIADKRGYMPHTQIVERVRTTLDWHLNKLP